MTLIIAVSCTDGVIMASDSQATEATGSVRWPVQKVFPLHDQAVIGGSGPRQIIEDIYAACQASQRELEASPDIGESLLTLVEPVLRTYYSRYIPVVPGKAQRGSAETIMLATGYTEDGGPWIIEIDAHCMQTHYEERGFHAIGSAAGFAQMANALMAHFDVRNRPVAYGELVAYRAMRAAIDTPAFGVGPPIQMWQVKEGGAHELSAEELEAIADSVGGWEEAEKDALERHMAPAEADEGPTMPPEVEPSIG